MKADTSNPTGGGRRSNWGPRILLADDDVGFQATLAIMLSHEFSLVDACNVTEAISLISEVPPEMLIVSSSLPGLGAQLLVHALRAHVPRCPVILVTAPNYTDVTRNLLALGIDGYFVKPLRFEYLLRRVRALLMSHHLHPAQLRSLSPGVSRAIQHMSCQFATIRTVTDLADLVGISAGHLSHSFSLDVGMSTKEYLTRMQIELAKRLLLRTPYGLEVIATRLGFYDASHFSRVFRNYTGQSPGRFRRI
jgi:YesN/AraC family two-component response regulator